MVFRNAHEDRFGILPDFRFGKTWTQNWESQIRYLAMGLKSYGERLFTQNLLILEPHHLIKNVGGLNCFYQANGKVNHK